MLKVCVRCDGSTEYHNYSRKCWWSLNLVIWATNDVFHTIQDLNLAAWYGIAIRTCTRKKIGGF